MKKLLALLLVGAMSIGLVACGNSSEPVAEDSSVAVETEAGTEAGAPEISGENPDITADITLWTYPVGGWGKPEQVDALIAGFNEVYPNITVTVEYLDYATGDDQVNTAIAGGEAPDLIFEGPERLVANWGAKGLMVDLSDLWESDASGLIYDSIEVACKDSTGAYYEYPVCMTAHCMAINYDMFEAADALQYIDVENHTWTTEGFQKAVEALVANGQQNVAAVYCGGQGGDQGTRALVNNLYGGTFTNAEHTEYTANSAENIQALELLKGMEGINFDSGSQGTEEIAMFCNGTLAMAFCWNAVQEQNNADAINFEVFPMSFPSDGTPQLQGGIWGFGIFDNGDANRIEASKVFIQYMTQDDADYTEAVKTSGYWPVRDIGNIYEGDELMTEYGMFMQYMGDYYQVTAGWAEARTAWWNMLQAIGGGTDVAAAVEEFVTTANAAAAAAAE